MITFVPLRDTLEKFTEVNPIIYDKELCCVLMDNGEYRWKIGDGVTSFNDLKYVDKISDIQEIYLYERSNKNGRAIKQGRVFLNGFLFNPTEK